MDLGSTNGTFLNGERIEAQRFYELLEQVHQMPYHVMLRASERSSLRSIQRSQEDLTPGDRYMGYV